MNMPPVFDETCSSVCGRASNSCRTDIYSKIFGIWTVTEYHGIPAVGEAALLRLVVHTDDVTRCCRSCIIMVLSVRGCRHILITQSHESHLLYCAPQCQFLTPQRHTDLTAFHNIHRVFSVCSRGSSQGNC